MSTLLVGIFLLWGFGQPDLLCLFPEDLYPAFGPRQVAIPVLFARPAQQLLWFQHLHPSCWDIFTCAILLEANLCSVQAP